MSRSSRSPRAIVDHQVQRWSQEQKRTHSAKNRPPVVTVSRQYGGRGEAIARAIADRLDYSCWDQELLHEIARHAHAPKVLFESLDEHRRNTVTEVIGVFDRKHKVTASDYLKELMRVLHTIANHGDAVIVGRGAQYILNPASTLRVRAVAELDVRVAGLVERNQISADAARAELAAVDDERRDFIRQNYDRDIEDPAGYDLTINTGSLSLELATEVVVTCFRNRFGIT
jgi:cytidylate kinase